MIRPTAQADKTAPEGECVTVPRLAMKMALADAIWRYDNGEMTASRVAMVKAQDILSAASPQSAPSRMASDAPAEGVGATWHREDNVCSTLLYTLKQTGWRKGEPVMTNAATVRIDGDNREEIAAAILAALTQAAPADPVAGVGERDDAAIGRDFLRAIEAATPDYPWMAQWSPADSYGELIVDLLDLAFPDKKTSVAAIQAFLKERDEALEPGEADDIEREASAQAIASLSPSPGVTDKLVEALERIVNLGSDGEHSGDRHARCRDIARQALAAARQTEEGA